MNFMIPKLKKINWKEIKILSSIITTTTT
jgi:hypothetical protein